MNSVEKIYSQKISNVIKKQQKEKEKPNKPVPMTSYHIRTIFQESTPSFYNNSKEVNNRKASGS